MFLLRMIFIETFFLQCCLFSGYLLGHASWWTFLKCYFFSSIAKVIVRDSAFCVSRFQSQIPHMFIVGLLDVMARVTHVECIGHLFSSHWDFMIDKHARIIYYDMDGSTFEHNIDCLKSLHISTRCDAPHLPYWGIFPFFIDEMIWLH